MESHLRVLQCIPSLQKGGAERLVIDICRYLIKRGIPCLLVVFSKKNDYKIESEGLPVVICKSKVHLSTWKKNSASLDDWNNIIAEFKPNVIHSHLFAAEVISRYQVIEGVKYITHFHDNMPQFQAFNFNTLLSKKAITNYYERRVLLKAYQKCNNHFISISAHTQDYIKQELNYKSTLVPNAIDLQRFQYFSREKSCNLITIGSFVDKKAQSFLIEVVHILKKQGVECKLNLLGDGPNKQALSDLAIQLNVSDLIVFHGKVNNPEQYLTESYLYVHSAIYEPFGLVLIEAMATGLPVVCTDGHGNRDIMEDGKNGFMLKNRNPHEFAEIVLRLFNNPIAYQKISLYATEFSKNYGMDSYIDKLLSVYHA